MRSITTADIKYYEKLPKGYVIFNIEVYFRGTHWSIDRRFNDFVALHQGLSREFRDNNLVDMPKKKFFGRFEKEFLEERTRALQAFLSDVLVQISPTTSASMNEFLEMDCEIDGVVETVNLKKALVWRIPYSRAKFPPCPEGQYPTFTLASPAGPISVENAKVNEHVDISQPQPSYNAVDAEFAAEQEELEERRLAMLVEDFANAMMDSSSVGVEPRGDAEVEAQRERLLRRCNGFSAFDDHLRRFFNSPVPNGAERIGGSHPNTPRYSDGLDGVMESLNGQPIISVQEQFSMSQQAGMGVADQYMQSRIQTGTSLVCHIENM